MSDCPVCDRWDGEHAPGCVIGALQDLGREGRRAHRRAQVLVVLQAHGEPMTLRTLEGLARIPMFDVSPIVDDLMRAGLVYPSLGRIAQEPTVCLTTAPHVPEACAQAAELLGIVLTDPRRPVSPVLQM